MSNIQSLLPLMGRILLSLIFVSSGFGKIFTWDQTAGYMASKGMPMVSLFLLGAIIFELAGGLSVLLGYRAKVGAILLMIFIIPASLIFHNFWAFKGMEQQMQMIMFMKNIAIIGGLIGIIANGSGAFSLDNRSKTKT